jgi:hypothetical protein
MSKRIKDQSLGKYQVDIDGGNFTLVKIGLTAPKDGVEQKETETICGHFSSMPGAINHAIRLLAVEGFTDGSSLRDYVEQINAVKSGIDAAFAKLEV